VEVVTERVRESEEVSVRKQSGKSLESLFAARSGIQPLVGEGGPDRFHDVILAEPI
jgi:hypothetical protein